MDFKKEFIETWSINNRINLYLLEAIDELHLKDVPPSKGRNVLEQFAHIHNTRMMWLKVAMPEVMAQQTKIEKDNPVSKKILLQLLQQSSDAISRLLENGIAEGKIKGFKPHVSGFLGYLIAHESHHRGQIVMTLKQCGHKVDPKVAYGLWEWGSR